MSKQYNGINLNDIPVDMFFKYMNTDNAYSVANSIALENSVHTINKDNNYYCLKNPSIQLVRPEDITDDKTLSYLGMTKDNKTFTKFFSSIDEPMNPNIFILLIPHFISVDQNSTISKNIKSAANEINDILKTEKPDIEFLDVLNDGDILYSKASDYIFAVNLFSSTYSRNTEVKILKVVRESTGTNNDILNIDALFGIGNNIYESIKNKKELSFSTQDASIISIFNATAKSIYKDSSTGEVSEIGFLNEITNLSEFYPYLVISKNNGVFLIFSPSIKQIQKRDSEGNILYKDSSGLFTYKEAYENNFFRHRNMMRNTFLNISKYTNWMLGNIADGEIVLLYNKFDNFNTDSTDMGKLAFKYHINETTAYEKINKPNGFIGYVNPYLKREISSKIGDSVYTVNSDTIKSVSLGRINNEFFNEVPAYIDTNVTLSEILDGKKELYCPYFNGDLNKAYILKCYTRSVSINDTEFTINQNSQINLKVFGSRKHKSINEIPARTYDIIGADTENPFIIIPLLANNESITSTDGLAALNMVIGPLNGRIKLEEKTRSPYISFNNNYPNCYIINKERAQLSDEFKDYVSMFKDGMYFIKFSLPKINKKLNYTLITFLEKKEHEYDFINFSNPKTGYITSTIKISGNTGFKPVFNSDSIMANPPIYGIKRNDTGIGEIIGSGDFTIEENSVEGIPFSYSERGTLNKESNKITITNFAVKSDTLNFTNESSENIMNEEEYYKVSGDDTKLYKKITTRQIVPSDLLILNGSSVSTKDGVALPKIIYSISDTSENKQNELIEYFNRYKNASVCLCLSDNKNARGDIVPSNTIFNKRLAMFKESLAENISNAFKKKNFDNTIQLNDEFYSNNGPLKLYNYSCAVVRCSYGLGSRVEKMRTLKTGEILGDNYFSKKRIILEKPIRSTSVEESIYNYIPSISFTPRKRNTIEAIIDHEKFPIEKLYREYDISKQRMNYLKITTPDYTKETTNLYQTKVGKLNSKNNEIDLPRTVIAEKLAYIYRRKDVFNSRNSNFNKLIENLKDFSERWFTGLIKEPSHNTELDPETTEKKVYVINDFGKIEQILNDIILEGMEVLNE